jgi:hypothetical protein
MDTQSANILVKRVKEVLFSVNERLHIPDPDKILKLEVNPLFGFHIDSNLVSIIFRVFYHYMDRPIDEVLIEIKVDTVFEVPNLKDYMTESGTLILPGDVITTLVDLSISHTRALLASNLTGTPFQEVILPIINPINVAKFFFAYMFNEQKEVLKTDERGTVLGRETVNLPEKTKKNNKIKVSKRTPSKNSY